MCSSSLTLVTEPIERVLLPISTTSIGSLLVIKLFYILHRFLGVSLLVSVCIRIVIFLMRVLPCLRNASVIPENRAMIKARFAVLYILRYWVEWFLSSNFHFVSAISWNLRHRLPELYGVMNSVYTLTSVKKLYRFVSSFSGMSCHGDI